MNVKHIKIAVVALVIVSLVILTGLYAFNGIEANDRNLPPGVKNVTQIQLKGVLGGNSKPLEVISEIEFPAFPKKMIVYKVDRNISEKEVKEIATALDINSGISGDSGMVSTGEDGYALYAFLFSAVIEYSNLTSESGYSPEYIDSHLPSDEEARKIADEFLDLHKLRPEGAVFSSTSHNTGHFVSPQDHIEIKNSESINVWYKHWINGHMILTDKLRIIVDVHGQVRKMFREWPQYDPYKEFSIIGPEEAYDYLQDSVIVIPDGMKNPEKATVTKVSLIYIDQTNTEDFNYLIPCYYFQGVVQGDGKEAAFYQCIPATPEFAAEIT